MRGEDLERFLRYSHIFSSAVREVLEERFLSTREGNVLSRAMLRVLRFVAFDGVLRVGDLARCLGVSAAATSKTVARLEELGLLRRGSLRGDRRATVLSASPNGRRLVRDFEDYAAMKASELVARLGAEKIERFGLLLEEASCSLLAETMSEEAPCFRCAGYFEAECALAGAQGGCAFQEACGVGSGGGSA